MFAHCSYHLLDSLMPPSDTEDVSNRDSLLRLQNICACAIVRDEGNYETLRQTPKHLHKILWKAYLRDEYYTYIENLDKYNNGNFGNANRLYKIIQELLCTWPYEEFTLKEVMPKLPPRLNSFSSFWNAEEYGPSYQISSNLLSLFNNVSFSIANIILTCSMDDFPECKMENWKIKKINLSGFNVFELDAITDMAEEVESIENYEPFLKNSFGKLEVILDVELTASPISDIEGVLDKLACKYSNHLNPVVLKFGHVELFNTYHSSDEDLYPSWGIHQTKDVARLIERLVKDGAESISLHECSDTGSDILEKVFENNVCQENILSLELVSCVSALNVVAVF
ncbi:unnamed protein product [Meganyctiphanes norvegica]|uniref:Uncharacterized protein n=1 Tax=Meganyctiphanes norvegica TaxID=48144 RepID=A0AAV2RAW5_MEGNR